MKHKKLFLPLYLALFLSGVTGCGRPDSQVAPSPAPENEAAGPSLEVATNQAMTAPESNPKQRVETRPPSPGKSKASKAQQDEIFTKPIVLSIDIEIPRTGMNLLRRTQWGGGGGDARPTARATVREGGVVYTNVAVHLKGAAGSFRPVDDQPALTLNFDKFVSGQSFHGLHKISLNNSVQDGSYLSEKICRELFDAAGVPVPRAGYALVRLNGRGLGLYVLLEGANKQFLKRYFNNTKGNLYDGGFVRDIDESLSVNSGDNPNDRSDITALRKALNTGGMPALSKALDVDRFLSMMAMEVMVLHWDGYALNKNNWRVFHDLDSDKMVFIPHGMDQTFGISQRCGEDYFNHPWSGRAAAAVMRTAEGKRRYKERFGQLYTNVFKIDQVLSRVDEIEAAIQPALARVDPGAARNQEGQAAWFKHQILKRHTNLGRQLGIAAPPLVAVKFGSEGIARLSGWKKAVGRTGSPNLSQGQDDKGNPVLLIGADANGLNTGFWRTQVVLEPGQYRFEGRLRVEGVSIQDGDQRAGAGLRVSRAPMKPHLTGTSDWTPYSYEFLVEEEPADVELICELTRTLKGRASFDVGSLRLVKVR